MANRVIYTKPYDAEIEYLESNGTKYINIGIIPKSKYRAICVYQATYSSTTKVYALFGSITSINTDDRFAVFVPKNNQDRSYWVLYATQKNSLSIVQNANDIHTIELGEDSYLDGRLIQSTRTSFEGRYKISLFAVNNANSFSDRRFIGKIFSFKLYNELNVLIFDAIPVRIGSIGYMYDKVSGKLFGNKGTGNFILGPDVANPVPNIRRVFRFGNKRFVMPMPYDSKIEYLETDGTQYINLGLLTLPVHTKIEYKAKCSTLQTSNGKIVSYGKVRTKDNFSIWEQITKISPSMLGKETQINTGTTSVHTVIMERLNTTNGVFSINDNSTNISGSCTTSENYLYLFADNGMNNYLGRLYYLKVITNNTLIINLIPVRRGNIGYLYDRISGKLFGNAGTGQFILGNDINN